MRIVFRTFKKGKRAWACIRSLAASMTPRHGGRLRVFLEEGGEWKVRWHCMAPKGEHRGRERQPGCRGCDFRHMRYLVEMQWHVVAWHGGLEWSPMRQGRAGERDEMQRTKKKKKIERSDNVLRRMPDNQRSRPHPHTRGAPRRLALLPPKRKNNPNRQWRTIHPWYIHPLARAPARFPSHHGRDISAARLDTVELAFLPPLLASS